jgi:hypothetical protein
MNELEGEILIAECVKETRVTFILLQQLFPYKFIAGQMSRKTGQVVPACLTNRFYIY